MSEKTQPGERSRVSSASVSDEEKLHLLVQTGLLLASERSLDIIVQAALDAGLRLSGARFGAFFYNTVTAAGEPYQLYKVSGLDPRAFASFPMPRPTAIFAETFLGKGTVRAADITLDARYGLNAPFQGMPAGHPPVRSYLAVPVRSRSGEVLGGLLYGHPEPNVFPRESEDLVATVASQAAVAIDNVRLAESLQGELAATDAARTVQRQTADRLQHALAAAQLGTWSWNASSDLIDFDERGGELFGVEPHVPTPRAALRERIVHHEDLGHTPRDLRSILHKGGVYSAEYRVVPPGSTERWVAVSGNTVSAGGGPGISGMVGTLQDITARKTAEATLRLSEKLAATGRLAATIAHEINNPLEAVTNLIYLCKTDPEVPTHAQRLLETADSELARVSQIAQQTLGFYRDTTRPVHIDLTALLHGVADLFSRKMLYRKLHYKLEVDSGLTIYGLQGEIRQVFSNLLVNAIDASSNAPIRIRARRCLHHSGHHGVSVLLHDCGSGIPRHVRNRLFTPFVTTKESVGTGLGLWVTRGIVEKQGGFIHFRSRTEDPTGTCFRVFLPSAVHLSPSAQSQSAFVH